MSGFLKKQSVGCYVNIVAAILGIAGLIAMIVCSTMTSAHSFRNLAMLVLAAVAAIVLVAVAIYAPNRWGNYDYVSSFSMIAAIALIFYVIGNTISQRIILISGLFSYNSGNTQGWSVFYATLAGWICLILAALLIVVSLFLRSVKEK